MWHRPVGSTSMHMCLQRELEVLFFSTLLNSGEEEVAVVCIFCCRGNKLQK